jgi:glycosyltransferase involved in cell wall biosynthesis
LRGHANDNLKILAWISGAALDGLLTNAMLFVLPSDIEGLSVASLDLMNAGLCVLTSDIPENREAVDGAGFTFRRGDAGDLADRLRFLIANPAVRKASGEAARRRVQERYQWNEISARVEEEYFKIMGWGLEKATARKPSTRVDAASGDAQRKTG